MKQLLLLTFVSTWSILSFAQNRYDIVIDELMADPTPVIGMPAVEWIEIKNTTNAIINLSGWRVADATSQSGAIGTYNLKPDSFLVICATGSLAQLSTFGPALSVTSFPSLDNDGDVISLKAPNGRTIHAVAYTSAWYQNAVKQDGGWTLEMIDTKNPCGGIDNWKASVDTRGGSPSIKNSVDAINADSKAPQLLRAYTNSNTQIVAVFNEPIDSTIAANITNYSLTNGLTITAALPQAPLFNQVFLNTNTALLPNTVYTLTVSNVPDCKGNSIGAFNKARIGLAQDADSLDILVNEILFNPKTNGYDFLEVYNKSNKIFDLNKLFIANKNTAGVIANVKKMSEQPMLFFPGDFIAITENATWIKNNYTVANEDWLVAIPSMPSFNDDEGNAIVLNFQGRVVDALNYKDDWHFKLIDNEEGISLERLSYTDATQKAENWHSASFNSGYATPTAKNSQLINGTAGAGAVSASPKTFSPDNDGVDDVLTINYNVTQNGMLANVTIYNASGVPVRNFKRNDLLGNSGKWIWDGLNDKGEKLPIGFYIIATTIFNTQGKKSEYKNTVVLARRLN
jgi:hypothetical protein